MNTSRSDLAPVAFVTYVSIGILLFALPVAAGWVAERDPVVRKNLSKPWIIDPMNTPTTASLTWTADAALSIPSQLRDDSFGALAATNSFTEPLRGAGWLDRSLVSSAGQLQSNPKSSSASLRSLDHADRPSAWLDIGAAREQFSIHPGLGSHDAVRELVIIDRGVADWESLLSDLRSQQRDGRALDVVLLDPQFDGVQQISAALRGYQGLQAVHIISHGVADGVQLGNQWLRSGNLAEYASDLVSWRDSLATGADLLFYGCQLAADRGGQDLVDGLGLLTGADVAASSDLTGQARLGGNWELEYQFGAVSSDVVFTAAIQIDWQQILAGTINIDQAWLNARGNGPYYLDQADTNYILQTNVSTSGTAFAIIAPNINFDLNGYVITYDNAIVNTIFNGSFEQGNGTSPSGWNTSSAPGATRFQGDFLRNEVYDGSYSLRFSLPASNQKIISNQTVTLEPNTTYSLSAMFEYGGSGTATNPGAKGFVQLVGEDGTLKQEVAWNQSNWRGIQFREKVFTTGSAQEVFYVHVGIENGSASGATAFYIDDLKIQKHQTYGVAIGPAAWSASSYSGITQFGSATNARVKNGTIQQGLGGATWGHGLFFRAVNGVSIENLAVTVNGPNSSTIFGQDQTTQQTTVAGCILTSNNKTISSRDNFHGAVVFGIRGDIYDNTIENGPHSGIVAKGTLPSNIFRNTIKLKSRYTNGFAINPMAGGQIYENRILCGQGEFGARGIFAQGVIGYTTKIFDNEIEVQGLVNNQEYEGIPLGGAYGIQLEDSKNIEVTGNVVTAFGNEVNAYAFRANSIGTSSPNILVENNLFQAVASAGRRAATIKLTNVPTNSIEFRGNTLSTNDGLIGETVDSHLLIRNSHLNILPGIGDKFIFETDYWANQSSHSSLSFLDATFENAETRTAFETAKVRTGFRYQNGQGLPDNRMSFSSSWTVTFDVKNLNNAPLQGVTVVVANLANEIEFQGMTDANGELSGVSRQFITWGENKTDHSSQKSTFTLNGSSSSVDIVADKSQVIDISLDDGSTSPPFLFEYENNKLIAYLNDFANTAVWSAASPFSLVVDGYTFHIDTNTTEIEIYGQSQVDQLQLQGASGNDSASFSPTSASISTPLMLVHGFGFEIVNIDGGGSGVDSVTIFDSIDSDLFESSPSTSSLTGDTFSFQATGFSQVTAHSTAGGNDIARLYDSTGNDQLVAYPTYVQLSGSGFSHRANGFRQTFSYSSPGGNDSASFYDSADADHVRGGMFWAQMYGTQYNHRADQFTQVNVYGTNNGAGDTLIVNGNLAQQVTLDPSAAALVLGTRSFTASGFANQTIQGAITSTAVVRLNGNSGSDSLQARTTHTILSGPGFSNRVNAFNHVQVYAGAGGTDTAQLFDSAGDDVFLAHPTWASLTGPNNQFSYQAHGFGTVTAFSSAAINGDSAQLYDSAGADVLAGNLNSVQFSGTGFSNRTENFKSVRVFAGTGGGDSLNLADTTGNDYGWVGKNYSSWTGSGLQLIATGFRSQVLRSERGGTDGIYFSVTGTGNNVNIFSTFTGMSDATGSYFHRGNQFASVRVVASGTNNTANLFDSAGNDALTGNMNSVRMAGTGYGNIADGFTKVRVTANQGGSDTLNLADSFGNDQIVIRMGSTTMLGSGIDFQAGGFRNQIVRSERGGTDSVELIASGSGNVLNMYESFTGMSNQANTYFQRADNFANVSVRLEGSGVSNQVFMYAASQPQIMEFAGMMGLNRHGNRQRRYEGFNRVTAYYVAGRDEWTTGDVGYDLTLQPS